MSKMKILNILKKIFTLIGLVSTITGLFGFLLGMNLPTVRLLVVGILLLLSALFLELSEDGDE